MAGLGMTQTIDEDKLEEGPEHSRLERRIPSTERVQYTLPQASCPTLPTGIPSSVHLSLPFLHTFRYTLFYYTQTPLTAPRMLQDASGLLRCHLILLEHCVPLHFEDSQELGSEDGIGL